MTPEPFWKQILPLVEKGHGAALIRQRFPEQNPKSIKTAVSMARKHLQQAGAGPRFPMEIMLPQEVSSAFSRDGALRSIAASALIERLLGTIARDDLVNAILDDGAAQ